MVGNKLVGTPTSHFPAVLAGIQSLQEGDSFTDLFLVCEGGQGVACHKAMLGPLSPLLRDLFDISTKVQAADRTVISLAGVKVSQVISLVSYIYRGKAEPTMSSSLAEVKAVAELLQINAKVEESEPAGVQLSPQKSKGRKSKGKKGAKGAPAPSEPTPVKDAVPLEPQPVKEAAPLEPQSVEEAASLEPPPASIDELMDTSAEEETVEDKQDNTTAQTELANLESVSTPDQKIEEETLPPKKRQGRRSKGTKIDEEPVVNINTAKAIAEATVHTPITQETMDVDIVESSRTRATMDKLKVGLKNCSKDKQVSKFYPKEAETEGLTELSDSTSILEMAPKRSRKTLQTELVSAEDESKASEELVDSSSILEMVPRRSRSKQQTEPVVRRETSVSKVDMKKTSGENVIENAGTGAVTEEYEVQMIVDKQMLKGKAQYLVQWKGWEDPKDFTWEPEANLRGSEKLLEQYEKMNKSAEEVKTDEPVPVKKQEEPPKKVVGKGGKKAVEKSVEEEYEVERIVDKKAENGQVSYLVQWRGWEDPKDFTWEPTGNLKGSEKLVKAYEKIMEVSASETQMKIPSETLMKPIEPESGKKRTKSIEPESGKKRGKRDQISNEKDTKILVKDDVPMEDEYEVEKIVEKKNEKGKVTYLVQWKGWEDPKDFTWEPMSNLVGSENLLKEYEDGIKEQAPVVTPTKTNGIEKIEGEDSGSKRRTRVKEFEKVPEEKSLLLASPPNLADANQPKSTENKENNLEETTVTEEILPEKATEKVNEQAVEVAAEEEYEVERIVDKKTEKGVTAYLVQWKGWEDSKDFSWEPIDNLKGSENLLKEYEKVNEEKTAPLKTLSDSIEPKSEKKRGKRSQKSVEKDNKIGVNDAVPIEEEYEVERIVEKKTEGGIITYLVQWKGWEDPKDFTWEPVGNLKGSEKLMKEYEVKNVAGDSKTLSDMVESKSVKKSDNESKISAKTIEKEGEVEKIIEDETAPTTSHETLPESVEPKSDKKRGKRSQKSDERENKIVVSDEAPLEEEYEVEKIIEKKTEGGIITYLVQWRGWEDPKDFTWEPVENLKGSEKLLKKFEKIGSTKEEVEKEVPKKASKKENKKAAQEEDEYEVEKVIDHKDENGSITYLVQWKGWEDPKDFTWEPKVNLKGSEKLIKEYEKTIKEKTTLPTTETPSEIVHSSTTKKKGEASKKTAEKVKKIAVEEEVPIEEEYEVERIIDKKAVKGKTSYLVKWKGWEDPQDFTWEPASNLKGSDKLLKDYEDGIKEQTSVVTPTKSNEKETIQGEGSSAKRRARSKTAQAPKESESCDVSMDSESKVEGESKRKNKVPDQGPSPKRKKKSSMDVDKVESNLDESPVVEKDESDDECGVVLCPICNRIFLTTMAFKKHEKEDHTRSKNKSVTTPRIKKAKSPEKSEKNAEKVTKVEEQSNSGQECEKKDSLISAEELMSSVETNLNESEANDDEKTAVPKYKPGPKSWKMKIGFSDETLPDNGDAGDEDEERPRKKSIVDLSDSSDDEYSAPNDHGVHGSSFLDSFFGSSGKTQEVEDLPAVTYNKDSDEESGGEHVNVDELIGNSDDEKND